MTSKAAAGGISFNELPRLTGTCVPFASLPPELKSPGKGWAGKLTPGWESRFCVHAGEYFCWGFWPLSFSSPLSMVYAPEEHVILTLLKLLGVEAQSLAELGRKEYSLVHTVYR